MIKNIKDLQEMDIVLRRDGMVLWVLRNENTLRLETFMTDLWGQQYLCNYYDDFTYGKNIRYFDKKRDSLKDIVAVFRPRSTWQALHLMHEYEIAKRLDDKESIKECIDSFQWIVVNN